MFPKLTKLPYRLYTHPSIFLFIYQTGKQYQISINSVSFISFDMIHMKHI